MKTLGRRASLCHTLLIAIIILSTNSYTNAVDPVDFLESLKDDTELFSQTEQSSSTEYPNGVNVIPGEAEVNYPVYASIPKSSFSCIGRPVGFYADTELRCQVWHICDEDRRQQSFLCTNGTIYSQEKRVCDWWYNVNCDPNEVSKNYLQNYDLYKGPPPKSETEQQSQQENKAQEDKSNNEINNRKNNINKNINEFDYQPTTKSSNRDQSFNQPRQPSESQQQPQRYTNNNNNGQYSKPTPSYNEPSSQRDSSFSNNNNNFHQQQNSQRRQPPPPSAPRQTTTTTTYRPPTTYSTPPPPAALQSSSFPPKQPQRQQNNFQHSPQQHNRQPQRQQSPTTTAAPRTQPSQKTYTQNGKRIVEIRVPLSQIPPEILAKYGKRIPEHLLKEIFLNFTRGQQQQLEKEAIATSKASNPSGTGNTRSAPPKAPIAQQPRHNNPPPPPPPSTPQNYQKKPVDLGTVPNEYKPAFASSPPSSKSSNNNNSKPPPPPPPPQEPQQKFRHSTPRRVDNVKFATPTRELLADYDDERQQVGESRNPAYSLQELFTSHHSRTSKQSRGPSSPVNEVPRRVKDSFDYEPTTTTTTTVPPFQKEYQPQQEFTRFPPRRRTQSTTTYRPTVTTQEPVLITDRYVPVATKEEKKQGDIRRILLVAKQGIQVLPPIPFLPGTPSLQEPLHPTPRRVPPITQRPHVRTTPFQEFSKLPAAPKPAIPEDYYVKNERFQEAESRYPTPAIPSNYNEPQPQARSRVPVSTTTTTTTTTTQAPTQPPTPFYQPEQDFRRTKPSKPHHQHQNKKKALSPPVEAKKPESSDDDYDNDGQPNEKFNTDELELLRLAQEYIELTGQDFGVRQQPRNA